MLETVLELGSRVGVGGREWDVRAVKPRALLKAEAEAKRRMEEVDEASSDAEEGDRDSSLGVSESTESGWEMVCRPKVGVRVSGGGFLGLWRRMEPYQPDTTSPATDVDEPEAASSS